MKVSYAPHADVLYIVFTDVPHRCVYVELDSGIVCRIDETTDKVVGVTIPDFRRRVERGEEIKIPELDDGISAERFLQEH